MAFTKFYAYCVNTRLIQNWLVMRRNLKELKNKPILISCLYSINKILNAFNQADHNKIRIHSLKLIKKSHWIGYFYLAKSLALQNKPQEARDNLYQFIHYEPYHTDAAILLSELEYEAGESTIARTRLYQLLQYSERRKIWQTLSNFVQNKTDFDEFHSTFQKKFPFYMETRILNDLASHLSNAALRANETEFALRFWKRQYELYLIQKSASSNQLSLNLKKKYNDEDAAIALTAIKKCLDKSEIPFFLISGTLLGCIRENKLLGHDKDIDIGVWDTHTVTQLKEIIQNSGCFYILPIYSRDILVVRHVNGISIDIFIHYKTENDYWHAGRKCVWHNTPFTLINRSFLGEEYLIPENYQLYLEENYGQDWLIPKIDFDSALDTPNMEVLSEIEFRIYLYKRILQLSSNFKLKQRLIQKLNSLNYFH
ncbi:capZB protein [Wielerella bovis]|uniref:capZB protein n=2 Tax=Wielerella bovis TaxID=2917790 RepID=UPI00201961EB|nr:capZB protein [Wielerella bovis]ULJ65313.1 capZB protein [Wielerella bovis]ULJ67660.1 capZB protein [Wielerella bovis]